MRIVIQRSQNYSHYQFRFRNAGQDQSMQKNGYKKGVQQYHEKANTTEKENKTLLILNYLKFTTKSIYLKYPPDSAPSSFAISATSLSLLP